MKKFEYAVLYFRRGKCVGKSTDHYDTLDEVRKNYTYVPSGEEQKFVRRKVGEWEEVKDEE